MLYPNFISWRIALAGITGVDQLMSHERAHRIHKAMTLLSSGGYAWRREEVTDEYLQRFIPVYEQHIQAKKNGTIFDVQAKVAAGRARGRAYEALSLWAGEHFVGAQLYSLRPRSLSVAYRVFPHRLAIKLPISPSYVAERLLVERALALGKSHILHGRDRNVYGPHAAIGLAQYKLNLGCVPYVSWAATTRFQALAELAVDQDTLVFIGSEPGERVTSAQLWLRDGEAEKRATYASLFVQSSVRVTVEQYQYV